MAAEGYIADHKLPAYSIEEVTNADPRFYEWLGPWLSRREIVDELGGPVWDDDDKQWYIARTETETLGMVAYRRGMVSSLYVGPGHRGQLAGTTMVLRLTLRHGSKELKATATDASKHLFAECGFKETGTRGRYYTMVRKP
jgi:L-amino acid N-acyltransferase YncA